MKAKNLMLFYPTLNPLHPPYHEKAFGDNLWKHLLWRFFLNHFFFVRMHRITVIYFGALCNNAVILCRKFVTCHLQLIFSGYKVILLSFVP